MPADFARSLDAAGLSAAFGDHAAMARSAARPAGGATDRPGAPAIPAQPGRAWWRLVLPVCALLLAIVVVVSFSAGGP